MRQSDIKGTLQADGTVRQPSVLPSTWAFKIKRFPSGLFRKIKARFCARGDRQLDEDVFDTCAPVASWKSIRMLMITALRQKWVTRQIDFSNAFVQAPMERDVYIALPGMFADTMVPLPPRNCA